MQTGYDLKYRPRKFRDVVGQDAVIKMMAARIEKGDAAHCILLTGPAGTGKTTLARIYGHELKIEKANVIEVDAASNSGIDAMKDLMRQAKSRGFGKRPTKLVIIDECHSITKQAWQALLKDLEEPPEHLYFALCTTEDGKVPAAIKTRSAKYALVDIKRDDIIDRLEYVVEKEELEIEEKALSLIAKESSGSMRDALVTLQQVAHCASLAEVKEALKSADRTPEFFEMCKLIVNGKPGDRGYTACIKILGSVDIAPETFRLSTISYVTKCLLGSPRNRDWLIHILNCLSGETWNVSEKQAPIIIALADIYLGE